MYLCTPTFCVRLQDDIERWRIEKGVRQEINIFKNLFTPTLEYTFQIIDWKGMNIKVNGKFLNNQRFLRTNLYINKDNKKLVNENKKHSRNCKKIKPINFYKYLCDEIKIAKDTTR